MPPQPMKSAFQSKPPRYPTHWLDIPAGALIQQAVTQVCNDYAQRIFGYHFVKLGTLSSYIPLTHSPIRNMVNVIPHISSDLKDSVSQVQNTDAPLNSETSLDEQAIRTGNYIVGQSHILPFSKNSIDGLLLANELDFAQDPHEILREVDRVITQSGYVMISGFNPLSLAGIAKFLPVKRNNILHDARFFTSYRIKDWLQLLGFEIVEQRQIMFSTLFFQPRWQYSEKIQQFLSSYIPWCSAAYVILARKRVIPMTAIRSPLRVKPRFAPVGAASARTPSCRLSDTPK